MQSVLEVNEDSWEGEIMQSDTLVVVDFWHQQCVWCKRLEPIYNEVAEEFKDKVKFAKLNVLENQSIGAKFGIMSTPTLGFFCEGRPIGMIVGFQPKERLEQLVNDMLENHRACLEKSEKLES